MEQALRQIEPDVHVLEIGPVDDAEGEIGRSFQVMRRVAAHVAAAARRGRFPVVLAGNCNASVGTWAGVGDPAAGMVWFDAHPDFSTPDEATGGYFDGMGVAMLAGQCWHRLMATIPGFRPLGLSRLVYCGIRDFEPGQREKVEQHGIRAVCGPAGGGLDVAAALSAELVHLPGRVVVHLDLDCLDPSVGQANEYAAPGGLGADELVACGIRAAEAVVRAVG